MFYNIHIKSKGYMVEFYNMIMSNERESKLQRAARP
jgi:hypothetical protein